MCKQCEIERGYPEPDAVTKREMVAAALLFLPFAIVAYFRNRHR